MYDRVIWPEEYDPSFRINLPLPASLVLEDRLDRLAEEARDLEGER